MSDAPTDSQGPTPDPGQARGQRPRSRSDLRRRLARHYLPIALASSVALVVFMNLPYFNANRYPPPMEIMVEGLSGAVGGATPMGPGMHGGGDPGQPAPDVTAGRPDVGSTDHGEGQPTVPTTEPSGQAGHVPREHGGGAETEGQAATASTEPVPDSTSETGTAPTEHGGSTSGSQSGAPPQGDVGSQAGPSQMDMGAGDTELLMRKYSTATGYVALGLLGLTLLVGPAHLMRGRRAPLSSYLARDMGIAAATLSVAHVIFGFLTQHSEGIVSYFFEQDDRSRILTTSFGLANWTGLAAVLIVAALAAISSDWALRKLKAKRWKRIQRLNYVLFPLVVAHAVLYGALLRLTSPYTALLGVSVVAVLVGQAVGIRLWRQRNAGKTAAATS